MFELKLCRLYCIVWHCPRYFEWVNKLKALWILYQFVLVSVYHPVSKISKWKKRVHHILSMTILNVKPVMTDWLVDWYSYSHRTRTCCRCVVHQLIYRSTNRTGLTELGRCLYPYRSRACHACVVKVNNLKRTTCLTDWLNKWLTDKVIDLGKLYSRELHLPLMWSAQGYVVDELNCLHHSVAGTPTRKGKALDIRDYEHSSDYISLGKVGTNAACNYWSNLGSLHQVPITAWWTKAVWNTKFALHFIWQALRIDPQTFWSWVQRPVHGHMLPQTMLHTFSYFLSYNPWGWSSEYVNQ